MSKAACKEIIDNGGMIQGLAESFSTTSKTQAQSLAMFGVAATEEGAQWLKKVKKFQAESADIISAMNAKAQELCMSQPIDL
jgi:hypothetical protein